MFYMTLKEESDTAIAYAINRSKRKYKTHGHLEIPIYLGLDGEMSEPGIVPYSGFCFELLTQAIFGNNHHNGGLFELEQGGAIFQPDLFNASGDLVETKSCNRLMQLKLIRKQTVAYTNYALRNPKKKVDFSFHSHAIDRMRARKLTRGEYLQKFGESICFSIKAPVAVPVQFYLNDSCITEKGLNLKRNEYEEKESGTRGYATSKTLSIDPRFLNNLLQYPEEVLLALSLNPDDFSFERYIVNDIKLNKKKIEPFPLLEIRLKDQEGWLLKSKKSLENLIALSDEPKVEIPKNKKFPNKKTEKGYSDQTEDLWSDTDDFLEDPEENPDDDVPF